MNLASIDDCWQIRLFLARVARESVESAWPPDAAELIGQARLDLFKSKSYDISDIITPNWPTSNGPIIESLLAQLGDQPDYPSAYGLTETIAELYPTEQERTQIRQTLHTMAASSDDGFRGWKAGRGDSFGVRNLMTAAVGPGPTGADSAHFQRVLLAVIGPRENSEQQATTYAQQNLLVFLRRAGHWATQAMPETVARLARTAQDRVQARHALLALLDDRRRPEVARALAKTIAALDPTQEEQAQIAGRCCAFAGTRVATPAPRSPIRPGRGTPTFARIRSCRTWLPWPSSSPVMPGRMLATGLWLSWPARTAPRP